MMETLIKVVAGFTVVFFFIGIIAVLWQVAKYMATRGMKEDEKYEG
nr:MAG TPA: Oxaloacetate decarboxylase, gamma chain [Caudoviricetes sp.]